MCPVTQETEAEVEKEPATGNGYLAPVLCQGTETQRGRDVVSAFKKLNTRAHSHMPSQRTEARRHQETGSRPSVGASSLTAVNRTEVCHKRVWDNNIPTQQQTQNTTVDGPDKHSVF